MFANQTEEQLRKDDMLPTVGYNHTDGKSYESDGGTQGHRGYDEDIRLHEYLVYFDIP